MSDIEQLSLLGAAARGPSRVLEGELPPDLRLVDQWLSADEEVALLAAVDAGEWRADIARRVQQHGLRYSGRQRDVPQVVEGGLPPWLDPVLDRLEAERALVRRAEQVNVNEYLPGQGIAAHVDVAHFGPSVAVVSLGAPTVMVFEHPTSGGRCEVHLQPRSLVVLAGESRSEWRHSIPKRKNDRIDGTLVPRQRRVSLTFRTLADDRVPDDRWNADGRGRARR
jgi:alkylated DNA repair dioxygenase AlkB